MIQRLKLTACTTLLAALAFFALAGCSRNTEGDNYKGVATDDKAMNEAIAKAKATAADFVTAFHAQKTGTEEFDVKNPYPVPGGGEEHMWIEISGETNGVLEGRIANDAEETRAVKLGQKVTLKLDEISDWKYLDNGKLVGGYTIRYFINKMSPKEREAFFKDSGFTL